MNKNKLKSSQVLLAACLNVLFIAGARADTYQLTLKNGSAMPISAGVVYAIEGQASDSEIGQMPSDGLVELCQMGNPALKIAELKENKNVKSLVPTQGPFLPGQSVTVNVTVPDPQTQSLHFVAMYGKSKELCSTINVSSQALRAMRPADTIIQTDQVIEAGAFMDAVLPMADSNACQGASDAVTCLRNLAVPQTATKQIHYFAGYLPSVVEFLEGKYGASDVLTLLVPSSGAVNFDLTRQN